MFEHIFCPLLSCYLWASRRKEGEQVTTKGLPARGSGHTRRRLYSHHLRTCLEALCLLQLFSMALTLLVPRPAALTDIRSRSLRMGGMSPQTQSMCGWDCFLPASWLKSVERVGNRSQSHGLRKVLPADPEGIVRTG